MHNLGCNGPCCAACRPVSWVCALFEIVALQTKTAKTQLIAHDKEVYDIAFSKSKDVFATVGADGSLRMFDLRCAGCIVCHRVPSLTSYYCHRSLEHSTIMYESENLKPLLRLAWNKQDQNYLATVVMDSPIAYVLDIRYACCVCLHRCSVVPVV